jgi:hypothetical protein
MQPAKVHHVILPAGESQPCSVLLSQLPASVSTGLNPLYKGYTTVFKKTTQVALTNEKKLLMPDGAGSSRITCLWSSLQTNIWLLLPGC